MSAFLSTFSAGEPDDDGDISTELEITVTNESSQPVHRIQYRSWLSGDEGACVDESDSYEDVYLAPGDATTFSPGWSRVHVRDASQGSIGVRIQGELCRRDFVKLGELEMPGPGESVRLQKNVDFEWYSGSLLLLLTWTEPDSDGDFNLEFKCLVPNTSGQRLNSVMIKTQLLDAEGVEIETSDSEDQLPALENGAFGQAAKLFTGTFWRPKARQLEGGKVVVSLRALVPIDRFEVEGSTDIGID